MDVMMMLRVNVNMYWGVLRPTLLCVVIISITIVSSTLQCIGLGVF